MLHRAVQFVRNLSKTGRSLKLALCVTVAYNRAGLLQSLQIKILGNPDLVVLLKKEQSINSSGQEKVTTRWREAQITRMRK